jgi:hypothetical protein
VALQDIHAEANVRVVPEDPSFCASVRVVPGYTPVARIARALHGSPDEGTVLYEVMMITAGARGPGQHLWLRDADGRLVRMMID